MANVCESSCTSILFLQRVLTWITVYESVHLFCQKLYIKGLGFGSQGSFSEIVVCTETITIFIFLQSKLVQWLLSSTPKARPNATEVKNSDLLKQISLKISENTIPKS